MVTAVAVAGDERVITAASMGDVAGAQAAALEWKRQQDEDRRQQAAQMEQRQRADIGMTIVPSGP